MSQDNIYNILFIEDSEDDMLFELRAITTSTSFKIVHKRVETSTELEIALKEQLWDVIISDYNLPVFGAFEAFKILKEMKLDIPFIIVSGAIGEEVAVKAMKIGVQDYVMKDNLSRLFPTIEREILESKIRKKKDEVENELKKSERRKSAILKNSIDAIISIDHLGKIIEFNLSAENIFGYQCSDVVGKELYNLILPEDVREEFRRNIEKYKNLKANQLNMSERFETWCNKFDQSIFPAEITLIQINIDYSYEFTVFIRDVSEQKKIEAEKEELSRQEHAALEAAIQMAKMKEEFIANMSHEIRTPLHGIMGMTELLSEGSPSGEQLKYLKYIKLSAESLLRIVNDILDFSKIESGKLEIEKIEFDLKSLLQEISNNTEFIAKQKKLNFYLNDYLDKNIVYTGDPFRIQQILTNLLNNAIKFTEKGDVTLSVSYANQIDDTINIRFEIQDTGIGIDKKNANKIFQAFSQVDGSITRRFGGTGLGLSICKRLVEIMQGEINFESTENKGTLFWFRIPLKFREDDTIKKQKIKNKDKIIDCPPLKILVAEDDLINQEIISKQLKTLGHSVDIVNNGQDVINLITKDKYDLILMDCQMPVLDGYEATKRIRKIDNPNCTQIFIIALTAHAIKGDREKCINVGMDDYITKPARFEELNMILDKFIKIRSRVRDD